jgi:hypothetical protein
MKYFARLRVENDVLILDHPGLMERVKKGADEKDWRGNKVDSCAVLYFPQDYIEGNGLTLIVPNFDYLDCENRIISACSPPEEEVCLNPEERDPSKPVFSTTLIGLKMKKLEKNFVPYEQALALKELGFDETCLAFYDGQVTNQVYYNIYRNGSGDYKPFKNTEKLKWFGAPLYQQAFRWFESKGYRNYVASNQFGGKVNYWFAITPPEELTYSDTKGRNSKEEAELACLIKLIEICCNSK